MKKYVFDISKLQPGDIILDRDSSRESSLIREKTGGSYSHARLFIGHTIMEAEGLAVQSVNPSRILYENINDAIVLRLKNASPQMIKAACIYASSQFGKEYGSARSILRKPTEDRESNRQLCTRLVAQSYEYGGVKIVDDPNYCTPKEIEESDLLDIVSNPLKEASQDDIKFAVSDGIMKDQGGYNKQSDIISKLYADLRSVCDGSDIQEEGQLVDFLINNPQYDSKVYNILKQSQYFLLWQEHKKTHPEEFSIDELKKKYSDDALSMAKSIWISGMQMEHWKIQYQAYYKLCQNHHLNSFGVFFDLYRNLLEMNEERTNAMESILLTTDPQWLLDRKFEILCNEGAQGYDFDVNNID